MDNAEDFSTSTQLSSKNTRGIRDPIYVNEEHDSDHEDNHEHHHHHDEDDEYIYKFSIKQMYIDTMNLDWSKVIWNMVICDAALHLLALGGLYLCIMGQIRGNSILFTVVSAIISGLGVTMGVHRLWAHRSYKAVFAVRLVLMCLHCVAFQHSIFSWSVNHRVHHKWPDTDRDLTNSRRGFFFAHMGWRMYETHEELIKGRKMVPVQDLLDDPVVRFQHEYFYWIAIPLSFVLPTIIPFYFWNEDLLFAFLTCGMLRLTITHHVTNCINSVAHLYGYKPYDKTMHARDHIVFGPLALGEGWHNYHHAFPRDYRASEMDGWCFNLTTKIIETLAKFGLTYELVTVSDDIINKRAARTGNPDERRHPRREVAGSARPSPQ